ncbi:MAG: hypothetical protein HY815_17810 [Candidatus Riflebacteria bacterium]|nr:hypothetical protein [Candidatus Riflebacteria bacterium]
MYDYGREIHGRLVNCLQLILMGRANVSTAQLPLQTTPSPTDVAILSSGCVDELAGSVLRLARLKVSSATVLEDVTAVAPMALDTALIEAYALMLGIQPGDERRGRHLLSFVTARMMSLLVKDIVLTRAAMLARDDRESPVSLDQLADVVHNLVLFATDEHLDHSAIVAEGLQDALGDLRAQPTVVPAIEAMVRAIEEFLRPC